MNAIDKELSAIGQTLNRVMDENKQHKETITEMEAQLGQRDVELGKVRAVMAEQRNIIMRLLKENGALEGSLAVEKMAKRIGAAASDDADAEADRLKPDPALHARAQELVSKRTAPLPTEPQPTAQKLNQPPARLMPRFLRMGGNGKAA